MQAVLSLTTSEENQKRTRPGNINTHPLGGHAALGGCSAQRLRWAPGHPEAALRHAPWLHPRGATSVGGQSVRDTLAPWPPVCAFGLAVAVAAVSRGASFQSPGTHLACLNVSQTSQLLKRRPLERPSSGDGLSRTKPPGLRVLPTCSLFPGLMSPSCVVGGVGMPVPLRPVSPLRVRLPSSPLPGLGIHKGLKKSIENGFCGLVLSMNISKSQD